MARAILTSLILLGSTAFLRGDVVVQNGSTGGTFFSAIDTYKIFFTTGSSSQWKIDSIGLFGKQANIAIGVALSFQLKDQNGNNLGNNDAFLATASFDPNKELLLTLTNVSQNTLAAGTPYQLHVIYGLAVATQADGNGSYTYPSGGFSNAQMKNGLGQTINGFQFQLNGTAVPEPATLALSCVGLAMGCAFLFLKGKRTDQKHRAFA